MSKLLKYSKRRPDRNFIGVSSTTIVLPIHTGDTTINVTDSGVSNQGVGLYPFSGKIKGVSTTGLE